MAVPRPGAAGRARFRACGRAASRGRAPVHRNYRPREVSGEGQNWAIVQDARGVIYVGSDAGVIDTTAQLGV